VKRKSSKALANSGHIVSNFPDEACWRATGSPIDSTLSRDDTASFQVLSEGQAYFKPKGILKAFRVETNRGEIITDVKLETLENFKENISSHVFIVSGKTSIPSALTSKQDI